MKKNKIRTLKTKSKEALIKDLNSSGLDLLYLSVWLSNQNSERIFEEFEIKAIQAAQKVTRNAKTLRDILSKNSKRISLGHISEALRIIVDAYLDPKNLDYFSENGDYLDDFVSDHLEAISYANSKSFKKASKAFSSKTNKRRNNKETGSDGNIGPENSLWITPKLVASHGGPQKFADTILEYISGQSTASIERSRHKYSRKWQLVDNPQISAVEIVKHLVLQHPFVFGKIKPTLFSLLQTKNLGMKKFMYDPSETFLQNEELEQTLRKLRFKK